MRQRSITVDLLLPSECEHYLAPAGAIQGSRLAARSCERAAVSLGCRGDRFSSVLGDLLYDLARRPVIALPGDIGLRNHSDERLALDDG